MYVQQSGYAMRWNAAEVALVIYNMLHNNNKPCAVEPS